jgi:hypothetical protein
MSDKVGGNKGLWDAGALVVAAIVTVLATACGGGSAPTAPTTTVAYTQETLTQYIPSIDIPSIGQLELRACKLLLPLGAHVSVNAAG